MPWELRCCQQDVRYEAECSLGEATPPNPWFATIQAMLCDWIDNLFINCSLCDDYRLRRRRDHNIMARDKGDVKVRWLAVQSAARKRCGVCIVF